MKLEKNFQIQFRKHFAYKYSHFIVQILKLFIQSKVYKQTKSSARNLIKIMKKPKRNSKHFKSRLEYFLNNGIYLITIHRQRIK